jgi:hypothetical protein
MTAIALLGIALAAQALAVLLPAVQVRRLARLTVETSDLACKTAIAHGAHTADHRRAATHQQIRNRARTN